MANTFTLKSSSYDGRYLQLTCTQTKNAANNSSTISWTLSSIGGNSPKYSTGPTTVVINGVTVYNKARVNYEGGGFPAAKGSETGTIVVAHDANGAATIPVKLSTAIYTQTVSTVNGNWTLDAINNGTILLTAENFNDEGNPTITYSNPVGDKATSVEACISFTGATDNVPYRPINKTAGSYTFYLTEEERDTLRSWVDKGYTKNVVFYVKSEVDGKTYYSTLIRELNLVNAEPEIEVNLYDTNPVTNVLTGNPSKNFVYGHSTISYTISANGRKGASIVGYRVESGSYLNTAEVGIISTTQLSPTATSIKFSVTDSRGNTGYSTLSIKLVAYNGSPWAYPSMDTLTTSAGGVYFDIHGFYQDIYFDGTTNGSEGGVRNTLSVQYRLKVQGAEDTAYSDWVEVEAEDIEVTHRDETQVYCNAKITILNLDYTTTYILQVKGVDKINKDGELNDLIEYTVRMVPVFDWSREDFAVNTPLRANDGVYVPDPENEGSYLEAVGSSFDALGTSIMLGVGSWAEAVRTDVYGYPLRLFNSGEEPLYVSSTGGVNVEEYSGDITLNSVNGKVNINSGGDWLHIDGQPMKDFVIQEGDNNAYAYRLWYSGKMEAWRSSSSTVSVNANKTYGNMYYADGLSLTTTGNASQFVRVDSVQLTINKLNNVGFWQGVVASVSTSSGAVTVNYMVTNPVSASASIRPYVYIIGRWK